jgi:zinc transporter, ZIP family
VIGFTLHNVTEEVGIAAPLTERRPGLAIFAALAALAGLPAVLGTWGGTAQRAGHTGLSLIALLGFVAGLAIMYATALLVRF